jgi:hypothetical protein
MRVLITGILALSLLGATAAMAAGSGSSDAAPASSPSSSSATPAAPAAPATPPSTAAIESQLQQLQNSLQVQSEQLDKQRAAIAEQQKRMAELEAELKAAKSTSPAADAASVPATAAIVNPLISPPTPPEATPPPKPRPSDEKAPLSFKIGAADFTPGGFLDMTGIFRTTNLGGIGTSFGSIPYNNTLPQAALSEARFSTQNSRISLKVEAPVSDSTSVMAYTEADFLGYQPPNADQTSNSNSLRMRLYFVNIKHGPWEFLAGQDWSLMTANRVGISPMPSDIFYTQNMDTNYQLGVIWARQPGFRVVYHATPWWTLAAALENPEQLAPSSVTLPGTAYTSQFDSGSGNTSSTTAVNNPNTPNLHPDIIVKSAFDWKISDHAFHVEAAGLLRSFKIYTPAVTSGTTITAPGYGYHAVGGGGSINANLELFKGFHLVANSFYSSGGGRYIYGLGPDAIVTPNGTLSTVKADSGLAGFEYQADKHVMFYGYASGAYFGRDWGYLASSTTGAKCDGLAGYTCIGFGYPGQAESANANRSLQEATFGIIPTLWSNPNYGKLQLITQYSYVLRAPWFVTTGAPKDAHNSMVYVDLRYTLP